MRSHSASLAIGKRTSMALPSLIRDRNERRRARRLRCRSCPRVPRAPTRRSPLSAACIRRRGTRGRLPAGSSSARRASLRRGGTGPSDMNTDGPPCRGLWSPCGRTSNAFSRGDPSPHVPGLEIVLLGIRIVLAEPEDRRGHRHEIGAIHRTGAGLLSDIGSLQALVRDVEPNRLELRAGFRTLAGLVVDEALFASRRADVRDRRQRAFRPASLATWRHADLIELRRVALVHRRRDAIAAL